MEIGVLHVGPGYGQKGGIASVLADLDLKSEQLRSRGIGTAIFPTRSFKSLTNIGRFVAVDVPRFIAAALRADVVHLHAASRGSLVRKAALFAAAKAIGRRCVLHVHAGDFFDYYSSAGGLYRAAVKYMVYQADARVVVSSSHRDEMVNCFGPAAQSTVVANYACEFERRCATQADPPDDGRYVLFAARLVESKGLSELLEAISLLGKRGIHVPLRVAGSGDTERWRDTAEKFGIADQVEFVGWIEGDAKVKLFARASIFCMPSHFESFGISTLEAMWAGRPVIGTEIGGFLDLVRDGETGYLVPLRDARSLAQRIEDLWTNPTKAADMGRTGRDAAERLFSSAAILDHYAALYFSIVRAK